MDHPSKPPVSQVAGGRRARVHNVHVHGIAEITNLIVSLHPGLRHDVASPVWTLAHERTAADTHTFYDHAS
eukprot:468119-Prymnesium_polylepis.1